jgi:hypothetical protein
MPRLPSTIIKTGSFGNSFANLRDGGYAALRKRSAAVDLYLDPLLH